MHEALNGGAVVADDETDLFSVGLVGACDELAADGRRVLVSRTDQTVRDEPFDPIPGLVASAEYVDEPRAVCTVRGEPRTATSGSSTANPPTTGTRRSWSVPRSPAGRAVGTATR
jgi:thymidine kinase